jgi:hypothetical protein
MWGSSEAAADLAGGAPIAAPGTRIAQLIKKTGPMNCHAIKENRDLFFMYDPRN